MGGLFFSIYETQRSPYDINFSNYFMNMKSRGDHSELIINESTNINNLTNQDSIKVLRTLSKKELNEYKQLSFLFGIHKLFINDLTANSLQPFEDPIMHKMDKDNIQMLLKRPKRKLICSGEIYNYTDLKELYIKDEYSIQSFSDVEIILPVYIKIGIQETLNILNGEFTFVITENIESYDIKNTNVFIARDKLGIKPLYMIKGKKDIFYLFVSELKCIPRHLLNNRNFTLLEFPPGCYWSYNNSIYNKNSNEFIQYYDIENIKESIVSTSTDTISHIYNTIYNKLTNSIIKRFTSSDVNVGILIGSDFESLIILNTMVNYIKTNKLNYKIYTFTFDTLDSTSIENLKLIQNDNTDIIVSHIVAYHDINDSDIILINNILDTNFTDINSCEKYIYYYYLLTYVKKYTDVKIMISGYGLKIQLDSNIKICENKCSIYDIIAGAFGLEIRFPYMDIDFVEYMKSLSYYIKSPQIYEIGKPPISKYIVRKSFESHVKFKSILWTSS